MDDNLATRMHSVLPAAEWELLQRVARLAGTLGVPLYVVGGLPRDVILGQPGADLDFVVEGPAGELAKAVAAEYGGRVVVHGKFGTAKWEPPSAVSHHALDFITARSETYKHPGALPTVKPGTIADDLRRRDFTINAIAIRLDGQHFGELRDDLNGRLDLDRGLVRVLYGRSFIDDPTRMYRAVRYEQRYAFRIADDTLALLPGARAGVERLSAQRLRHELDLILDEPRARAMLARLADLGLLAVIHPALAYDDGAQVRLSAADQQPTGILPALPQRQLRWLLWLMALPVAQIEAIDSRLHFSALMLAGLRAASALWAELDAMDDAPASRWAARLQNVPLPAAYAVCLALPHGAARAALETYLSHWRHIRPHTTGDDLKDLGVKPGPEYRRILSELRRAWLDGEIKTEQEEQEYLHSILRR